MLPKCIQICIFMLLIGAGSTFAEDETPVCPSETQVEQNVVLPAGNWKEYDSRPRHLFINVMFSEGEPSKQMILSPTQQRKKGRKQIDTWKFTPSDAGYWISCEYTGTSMVLSRKLPDHIKSCEVEYDAKFSTPVAQRVICKP
jgi:hypothetical protein